MTREPVVPHPAVLADDLRALAEVVPFDHTTHRLLEVAADLLDDRDLLDDCEPSAATGEAPSYEQIADTIQQVLDAALITIHATQNGHPITVLQIARCLDKAGLIDWAGVPR